MSGWRSSIATSDFAPENTISCNDIRLIKSLVLRGSGVTLLSLLDVLDEVQRGQLAFVPLRSTLLRPLTLALCTAPLASAFAARANGHSDAECGDPNPWRRSAQRPAEDGVAHAVIMPLPRSPHAAPGTRLR